MKNLVVISALLMASSALAVDDLPYVNYYGQYEVTSCKKTESTNSSTDLCNSKKILIEKAPASKGAPHTSIFFVAPGEKFPKEEIFSPGTGINPEYYKYNKDDDGSDHYYVRTTVNQNSYVYTDFWLNKNQDQTVTVKFKRRETPKDESSNVVRSSFQYEMKLKAAK